MDPNNINNENINENNINIHNEFKQNNKNK